MKSFRLFALLCLFSMLCVAEENEHNAFVYRTVNDSFYVEFVYPELKQSVSEGFEKTLVEAVDKALNYPTDQSIRFEGEVTVAYSLYRTGRISHVSVIEGLCPEVDKAVKRVLTGLRFKLKFPEASRDRQYCQRFYVSKDGRQNTQWSSRESIVGKPEQPAVFPGGDEALQLFIKQHLRYPKRALEEGEQAQCLVEFVVDEQGKVCAASLASSTSYDLEREALRLVMSLPTMQPAFHQGHPVKSAWLLPIVFRLTY